MSTQIANPFPSVPAKTLVADCPLRVLKTWIAIQLVDENDKPIPDADYILIYPDKSQKPGKLDANGYQRIDHLEPGDYEVGFPILDPFWGLETSLTPVQWKGPSILGAPIPGVGGVALPPSAPPVAIDITLLDEADKGIPKQRFEIDLPNGDKAEGFLDDDGKAHVNGIEPAGDCSIRFPDIDPSFITFKESI